MRVGRRVIGIVLLILILIGLGVRAGFLWKQVVPAGSQRAQQVKDWSPTAEDLSPPPARGGAIWLLADRGDRAFDCGKLVEELFRQALLVAARDGMGLQTRDASLREWQDQPPVDDSVAEDFDAKQMTLHDGPVAHRTWLRQTYDLNRYEDFYEELVERMERLSRQDYVAMLRKQGWSGSGNVIKHDAPAAPEAEAQLSEMEEISQLWAIRGAHELIRKDGESPARLGVLVRGYANLGQLTRYHWSSEYAVYAARSLLYAQRMVANDPASAFALWHRAYARALAGLQGEALADLAKASALKSGNRPAWVDLLKPYCRYQTGELVTLASNNNASISASEITTAPLAMFLAFLTVERSQSQGATMNLAQAALEVNPRCLRLIDAMCDQTGPGMLNQLTQTGPQVFSQTLGDQLEKTPELPQRILDEIHRAKRQGGNPDGREDVCRALISEGSVQQDMGEPSWAALGRMIQETTFVHVERMANLISEQWGVDASDYAKESEKSVEQHPFSYVIKAYGLRHARDQKSLKETMKDPNDVEVGRLLTLRAMPLYFLERSVQSHGPRTADYLWKWIDRNSDCNSFDEEEVVAAYRFDPLTPYITVALELLRKVSPESPVLIANDIAQHWDAAKAARWEADHGDYPTVAMALGKKYTELKRWSDAERCLRKYVAVSTDHDGYEALAAVYEKQNQMDLWLATLKEFLARGQDYGLERAMVDQQIADYYMAKGDYKSALPYADAAAGTASAWGLLCAADAHTGLGDWTTAEQLIREEIDHYSASPFALFSWQMHTGHGDLAATRKALHDYYTSKGNNLTGDDLGEMGILEMVDNDDAAALGTFRRYFSQQPEMFMGDQVAVLADELQDGQTRDAALSQVVAMQPKDAPYLLFAAALRDAVKSGPKAVPDEKRMNAVLANTNVNGRVTICALAAHFAEHRGQPDAAVAILRKSAGAAGNCWNRPVLDAELRAHGMDPLEMARATTRPQ